MVASPASAPLAAAAARKGDVAHVLPRPVVAFQTSANRRTSLCCGHCLCSVGSLEVQAALAAGYAKRSDVVRLLQEWSESGAKVGAKQQATILGPTFPEVELPAFSGLWRGGCPVQCGRGACTEVYCSTHCLDAARAAHAFTCAGEGDGTFEFRKHAARSEWNNELLGAASFSQRADLLGAAEAGLSVGPMGRVPPWTEYELDESWILLSAASPSLLEVLGGHAAFKKTFAKLAANCCTVVAPSPLSEFCRALPLQSPLVRAVAAEALGAVAERLVGAEEALTAPPSVGTDERLRSERRLARLAQAADAAGGAVPDGHRNPLVDSMLEAQVLLDEKEVPQHSCCPNAALVAAGASHGHCLRDPLRLALAALRDVSAGEELTIARVDVDATLHDRWNALARKAGGTLSGMDGRCPCFRCLWEGGDHDARSSLSVLQLRALAHQAMQHGRSRESLEIWAEVLHRSPDDGEALHGIAGTHLEAGRFCEARAALAEGSRRAPGHVLLAEQAARAAAYYPFMDARSARLAFGTEKLCIPKTLAADSLPLSAAEWQGHLVGTVDLTASSQARCERELRSTVYVTTTPVLSISECDWAVAQAEAHAQHHGGWSTARHYGAPTTDVPLNEVPALLEWFNGVLERCLTPLLQSQYGKRLVFRCSDAFLVRYAAEGGQRHLPIHTDQSTHSAVIALNGADEFEGGGTYFCSLGTAVRPSKGHVLTLQGARVRHGGDPVLRGVRYIIAVFFLAEDAEVASEEPAAKRPCERQGVLVKWWT